MADKETLLLILKGMVSDLPPEEQQNIKDTSDQLRKIVQDAGQAGLFALAIVGAEMGT